MKMKRYLIKCLALAVAALLCGGLATGCAPKTELLLSGVVEAQQYDVCAQTGGPVVSVLAEEGASLEAGERIARIDWLSQCAAVDAADAAVAARTARLAELRAGNREESIDAAKASVKAAQAKYGEIKEGAAKEQIDAATAQEQLAAVNVENARVTVEYTKKKYEDAKDLYNDGAITESMLDDAIYKRDTAEKSYEAAQKQHDAAAAQLAQVLAGANDQQLRAAYANVEQAKAQLALLKDGATSYAIDAAQADLDAAVAQQKQAQLTRDRCVITAPVKGTLASLSIRAGEMVNSGAVVASIVDLNDLWARVYIPQAYLQRVSLGQTLALRCPAYPGREFSGTVTYIADEAQFTPKNIQTDEDKANTVFLVKIAVNGEGLLKPGMTANAVIPLG